MKKLFYLLIALPLLFVACDNREPSPYEPIVRSLELTSEAEMNFDAEGGNGTINYLYTPGAITGNEGIESEVTSLTIKCDADWIEVAEEVMLSEPIEFTVLANNSTASRKATITASIDHLSFEVTVKQAAASDTPEPEPSFEGWGIIGTMNEWSVANAIVMEEANGYYVANAVELATSDKFKFIKDGDNAQNRGGNGQAADPDYYYTAQLWGSDIYVSEAGTYDIYLNKAENTYYIMSEGKSPAEALEPLAPGEDLYEAYGNFEGDKARLTAEKKYYVAKGVKFNATTAEFDIRVNENEKVFGAKEDATYAVEEQIAVAEGDTKIKVAVEADKEYDIYYRSDISSVWLMPAGVKPLIWEEVTGVAFSTTNFAINMKAEGLEFYFDFNCGVAAENDIIPEAIYYVNDENNSGFNFNLENEYDIRIDGVKSKLKDGTMTIKHISGGYDITIDVESIHNHKIKAHYAGPIGEITIMGRPITNPE